MGLKEDATAYFAAVEIVKDKLVAITKEFCPKANVMGRFIYDENTSEWGGILKSDADKGIDGQPRVHAITIYYDGFDQEKNPEMVPAGCMMGIIPFRFDFFHQYEKGTDADNTEKRMQKEVVELAYILNRKPVLDLSADPAIVSHHNELVVPAYRRLSIKPPTLIGPSNQFRVHLNPDDLRG